MKWAVRRKPENGEKRCTRRFAWLPVWTTTDTVVWLQRYWIVERYRLYTTTEKLQVCPDSRYWPRSRWLLTGVYDNPEDAHKSMYTDGSSTTRLCLSCGRLHPFHKRPDGKWAGWCSKSSRVVLSDEVANESE